MRRISYFLFALAFITSCKQAKNENNNSSMLPKDTVQTVSKPATEPQPDLKTNPLEFIPNGYELFSRTEGDLNKDGKTDVVLMIKATDPKKWVDDEYRGRLNRNRRGLIILFKRDGGYELAAENDECFTSENEDGCAYYPPELSLSIQKNILVLNYAYGRYGYWEYIFRYQNNDFELIGYNSYSCRGGVTLGITEVNFSTRTYVHKENVNAEEEDEEEVFKVKTVKFKRKNLIKLTEITDFDELDLDLPNND